MDSTIGKLALILSIPVVAMTTSCKIIENYQNRFTDYIQAESCDIDYLLDTVTMSNGFTILCKDLKDMKKIVGIYEGTVKYKHLNKSKSPNRYKRVGEYKGSKSRLNFDMLCEYIDTDKNNHLDPVELAIACPTGIDKDKLKGRVGTQSARNKAIVNAYSLF